MKYRIVEVNEHPEELKEIGFYIIEKEGWFGSWSEVKQVEVNACRLKYETYHAAEDYMRTNYMGYGLYHRSGNIYEFFPYSGWC